MRKITYYILTAVMFCLITAGCGNNDFTSVSGSDGPAVIYPDYKDITIPANIAPLNYRYAMKGAKSARTTFSIENKSITIKGLKVEWGLKKWKSFIAEATGKDITVNASVKVGSETIEDSWTITVSEDLVDSYLTYRLIEPAYQMWNEVSINERCIENFEETSISNYKKTNNSCMNCHIHGQQRGDLSIFYIRGAKGGAILNRDGELRKLNLKVDGMLSGTVYGELHPSGRFGVFSTNIIIPGLRTLAPERMEVYDTGSDLTVADFDNNKMINLPHLTGSAKFETFPCFSADGEYVFYCVADSVAIPQDIKSLKYSLVRAAFNTSTGEISEQVDTIWSASEHNASMCHPKASPDGKWIMFSVADFGTFPIDHHESALNMINLETGELNTLIGVKKDNSGSDTYHSWSSNSKWFVFSSKRGDSQYSKPYFCHLDENGNPTKPFVLPQKTATFYEYNLKSFNIPDLGKGSTGITLSDTKKMFNSPSEAFN